MTEPIKVQDSRFLLAVCIPCTVFFGPGLILSAISGMRKQDMDILLICIPVFGGFLLMGLLLSVTVIRRKLLLYEDHISYTPAFGRTRSFSYEEIKYMRQTGAHFILYGYDSSKLAVFENNMPAFLEGFNFLMEKGVRFIPQNLPSPPC